jgi:hypothetical protein
MIGGEIDMPARGFRAVKNQGETEMIRKTLCVVGLLVAGFGVAGCGNPVDQVVKNEATRGELMTKIAADPALAGEVLQKLLSAPETQSMVLDQVLQNGEAAQSLMLKLAQDQTRIDAIINVAVQDPAMKDHLVTLFRGMQMAQPR